MSLLIGHTRINAVNPYIVVGKSESEVSKKDVNFYANGKLIQSYSLNEVSSLSELPEVPDKDYCVADGWNYTLDQVKALKHKTDIGAQYKSYDGKTRIFITIQKGGRLSFRLHCSCTTSGGATIDWGDDTTTEITDTTSADYLHTYSKSGQYVIAIEVTAGTLTLGRSSNNYSICGSTVSSSSNQVRGFMSCINDVIIGNSITSSQVNKFCFSDCPQLKSVVVPSTITGIDQQAFSWCISLKHFVVPNSVTWIAEKCFYQCNLLNCVSLPMSVTWFGNEIFRQCGSLLTCTIPSSITTLYKNFFYQCLALAEADIPDSVTALEQYSLYNCSCVRSLVIPASVKTIGQYCLSWSNSLSIVKFLGTPTTLSTSCFRYCYGLKLVDLHNATEIPTLQAVDAFNDTPDDLEIVVPDSLYDEWIQATNWSDSSIKGRIVKYSESSAYEEQ